MTRKTLVSHACWAAAVLAAFGLGSLRQSTSASNAEDQSPPQKGPRLTSAGDADLSGSGTRAARRAGSSGATGGESALARIFGDPAAPGKNWEDLARQAVRDPNPLMRRLAFNRILESMTAENAVAIREQLVAMGAEGDMWNDFNYSWGALAGRDAFDFAAVSEERDLNAALAGWASARPQEAIALLDNLPEDMRESRDRLAESVVSGLADRDQQLATDLVLRLASEGNQRSEHLMSIVASETIRAAGTEEAASWSTTLPDGPLKAAAMHRVAGSYVNENPTAAAAWAEQFAAEGYAARAVAEVGRQWARSNPLEAVGWLEQLPEGEGQIAGLRSTFGDWEDRDPVAAGEYLLSMPSSPQRDSAISGFSSGYAWQDPQTAITWAQDISDPNLRRESLTRAGQIYFRRDPNSARAWLESSGLPAEIQEAVLNPPQRRQ